MKIPLKLADKDPMLVAQATKALEIMSDTPDAWELLVPLKDVDLDRVYGEVRELYRQAFDWDGRDADRPPYLGAGRSMRMHMREWITRWDLERLDPSYTADIEAQRLSADLTERQGMEGFSEDDSDEAQAANA